MDQPDDIDSDALFSADRVERHTSVELPLGGYLEHRYDLEDPVLTRYRGERYDAFSAARTAPPFVQELLADWERLYREPFVGVTTDGTVRDVHPLPAATPADPAPVAAAQALLAALSPEQRERLQHPLDSLHWRAWSNPEFVIHPIGLRLEDLGPAAVEAALDLVRASLSREGFERVRTVMALNGLLGEIVQLPTIMNEHSYWIALYGGPSVESPWGWQLFGHHLALNTVFVAGRTVIAPVFLGAEPAVPTGEHPALFEERERLALELVSSLDPEQRARAVVWESVLDPGMPADRLHPADERHVAGAFRDNRVIPYEGLPALLLDTEQRRLVRALIADSLVLLPERERALLLERVEEHLDETHVSWYGATDGSQPFYLRLQSPVILTELDHHAGVWLSNRLPARFHVHTTLRLPHGNDYAKAYLRAVGREV